MHACGHDAHTAYMLILETLIEMKDQFNGKVIVIHQPRRNASRWCQRYD